MAQTFVGFTPTEANAKLDQLWGLVRVVINVADPAYGAVGDGVTDNAAAFQLVSNAVNRVTGTQVVTVVFPAGHYVYSSGLLFTRPVWIQGGGKLDYTGTGYAIELGPNNLTPSTFQTTPYTVDGISFTGGASMTHGIYVNSFIVSPRFLNIEMINFGCVSGYAIYCQSDNWDTRVHNLTFWTNGIGGDPAKNFLRMNGYRKDGTTDFGQSNFIMTQTQLNNGSGIGVGIYLSGVASRIERGCTIAGFSPNIWVGGRARLVRIDAYFESIGGQDFWGTGNTPPCIAYGDPAGHPDAGAWCQGLELNGVYCNLHNGDIAGAANVRLLGPSTQGSEGLQYCTLNRVTVEGAVADVPIVTQNNALSGQVGNRAAGTLVNGTPITAGILHTAGVTDWAGEDEKLTALAGVIQDGGGVKHRQASTGSIAANTTQDVEIDWLTPFADTAYNVVVSVLEATGQLTLVAVKTWSANGVTVTLKNASGGALTGAVNMIAFHF